MNRQQQKELGLVSGVIVYSAIVFWYLAYVVTHQTYTVTILALILSITLWVALLALTFALSRHGLSTLALGTLIPVIIVIVGRLELSALGAALILALLILTAKARISLEINNRIKYRTLQIFFNGTRLIVFGAIVVTVGLALPVVADQLQVSGIHLPESTVAAIIKPFESTFRQAIPGYQPDATVDQFIEAQLNQQLQQLPPGTQLPPEQIDHIRQQLAQQLNQDISGQESIASVITATLNQRLNAITQRNPFLATLVALITATIVIRIIVPALTLVPLVLIAALIYLTQQLGFTYILKTEKTIERLRL